MLTCHPAHIICCGWLILLCAHANMPIYSKIWSGSEICEGEHSKMSKVAWKLLGHVTMWPSCRTHITWSLWSVGYCSSFNGFSYGILILNSHLEDFYQFVYYAGPIVIGNTHLEVYFRILLWDTCRYFYGSVSVLIPHMVYSYGIFYYGSYISNFYIYNYYILYIIYILYIYIYNIYILYIIK